MPYHSWHIKLYKHCRNWILCKHASNQTYDRYTQREESIADVTKRPVVDVPKAPLPHNKQGRCLTSSCVALYDAWHVWSNKRTCYHVDRALHCINPRRCTNILAKHMHISSLFDPLSLTRRIMAATACGAAVVHVFTEHVVLHIQSHV